jgi:CxxC-x17-CxxC domain-containing protein
MHQTFSTRTPLGRRFLQRRVFVPPMPFAIVLFFSSAPWRTTVQRGFGGMSDTTITCRDCGQAFTFTAGEQAFYQERGFSEPQRCAACRAERKTQRETSGSSFDRNGGQSAGGGYASGGSSGGSRGYASGPRQLYPAVCSACGKETDVPFQPRTDKPVYCRACFAERRPAPATSSYRY